jgi:hypothetical protein
MFKNRFIVVLGALSILLVTMAVAYPRMDDSLTADQNASDFHQRHPEWTWTIRDASVVIPVAGDSAYPDYYQRHRKLSLRAETPLDTTDYFFRHPELMTPARLIDLTDYYFRHPGQ